MGRDKTEKGKTTQTSNHDDEEVGQFYEQLNSAITRTPKKDLLVVEADWNAITGQGQ